MTKAVLYKESDFYWKGIILTPKVLWFWRFKHWTILLFDSALSGIVQGTLLELGADVLMVPARLLCDRESALG